MRGAIGTIAASLGPVHAVVGHSVGGAASLLATRFGLEVARLALIAPPTTPADFATGFARHLGLGPFRARRDDRADRELVRPPLRGARRHVRAERLSIGPILVVHDREDPVVGFDNGRRIATAAPRGEAPRKSAGCRPSRHPARASRDPRPVTSFVDAGTRAKAFAASLRVSSSFATRAGDGRARSQRPLSACRSRAPSPLRCARM